MKRIVRPFAKIAVLLGAIIFFSIWYFLIKPVLFIVYIVWNFQLPPKTETWTMGEDAIEEAVSGPYFSFGTEVVKEI